MTTKTKAQNSIAINADTGAMTEIGSSLEDFQSAVGGYIEPLFTEEVRNGQAVTGYVNEEGMYQTPNVGLAFRHSDGRLQPLFGNLVITGLNLNNGNTRDIPSGVTVNVSDVKLMSFANRFFAVRVVSITFPR